MAQGKRAPGKSTRVNYATPAALLLVQTATALYLADLLTLFRYYKSLAERAMAQVTEAQPLEVLWTAR